MTRTPEKILGWVGGVGAAVASIPAAVAVGGLTALNGESFDSGFSSTVETMFQLGGEFGDEYGGKFVGGFAYGLVAALFGINPHHD